MLKKITISFLSLASIIFLSSCLSEEKKKSENSEETAKIEKLASKVKAEKIKTIFYSLPSPLELTLLFKREGVEYHYDKLHNVKKREDYVTTVKKSLNLGVYGADLSYSGLFAKHGDAIQYFSVAQVMAEDLGIGQTFQREFITRLEQNASNKDTLLQVISDFFLENDIYLKDQNQQDISTYVLVGGWIEGLYLGTHMISEKTNSLGIKEIIIGQLNSLDNLIILLDDIGKSIELKSLKSNMIVLREYYDEIAFDDSQEGDELASQNSGELIIDNHKATAIMSDSTFNKVKNIVTEIRNSITR